MSVECKVCKIQMSISGGYSAYECQDGICNECMMLYVPEEMIKDGTARKAE